jgi:Isochorismatase family
LALSFHVPKAAVAILAAAIAATLSVQAASAADTIIEQWQQVKPPAAPPELKPVTVDDATTALLMLDFSGAQDPTKGPCNSPRCIGTIPAMKILLDRAREKNVYVVYSLGTMGTSADIATALAPKSTDPVVQSTANKFGNTNLDKLLAAKNIKTLILTGTVSQGAILFTATEAVARGFNVIVPVDGMSSPDLYAEQYVAWHLTHSTGLAPKTTLTRSDMIKF